ncbi:MAG: protein kinase [Polyangiaceae bacterium]|nr:protein kinase [Polyangiaceae bacterium]
MISLDESARLSAARVGSVLKNKWVLNALIGVGGMAAVYSATHRNGSRAAVKILHPELAGNAAVRARFQREGYAANAIEHPGVVRVLDDDVTEDGLAFLVMDLLEGETLERRALSLGGRLGASEVLEHTDAVLDILAAAHDRNVIHRDLKPDNLFLTRDGVMKVLDFGLASVDEKLSSSIRTTRVGWSMGTPGYMSPEQARGDWAAVDARSDLWALGASMFSLLSGRIVHDSENPQESVVRAATRPAPSLATVAPALPSSLTRLVDRALAFDPRERFQSAASMRVALRHVRDDFAPRVSSRVGSRVVTIPEVALSTAPPTRNTAMEMISPVEIAPDTFWVGKRDPKAIFHSNPYLRIFRGQGPDGRPVQFNLLADPGSSSDFAVVSAKVSSLIGSLDKLSALHINHQDPDVGSSAFVISMRFAPRALILSSEATWRLIVHFNLPRERYVDLDKFAQGFKLPTGHTMIPVPTPFCHFRGSTMLYDHATRVLFSGDLFGGVTTEGVEGLWADESDWPGMRAFHQMYMPTQRALANAVSAIRKLDPPVEIIAPQHGRVIRGGLVDTFLDRLEHLPVGLDVMEDAEQGVDMLVAWNSVLHRVVNTANMIFGEDVEPRLLAYQPLHETLVVEDDELTVTSLARWTVGVVVAVLTTGQKPSIANPIKLEAILACEELDLPSPELRIEDAEASAEDAAPIATT